MKIQMHNGLPMVSVSLLNEGNSIHFDNVLLETGCSTTIFNTDEVDNIGLTIDRKNGMPKRMYGVGGESELCYEQTVYDLEIDNYKMDLFQLQLGITKETYGFNGILGVDFMTKSGLIIDFEDMIAK
jgi:hypothetical protein